MKVEVIRSARRRKTVQARIEGKVLKVMVPDNLSPQQEAHWVDVMRTKLERKGQPRPDLEARAAQLARTYDLPAPTSVEWSDRQNHRWGSCTPTTGRIRLSSKMAGYPAWVVDYVLVHELAHISESGHGAAFKALVGRYPRSERAKGYLIAKAEPVG